MIDNKMDFQMRGNRMICTDDMKYNFVVWKMDVSIYLGVGKWSVRHLKGVIAKYLIILTQAFNLMLGRLNSSRLVIPNGELNWLWISTVDKFGLEKDP